MAIAVAMLALGVITTACTPVPGTVGSASPAPTLGTAASLPAATAAAPAGGATQKSEGGQVTVDVTWLGTSAGPVFKVVMDTHAVELDGYDLRQTAVLRTEDGGEFRPTGWDAPKGGHHREGLLTFAATTPDGRPVLTPGRWVELIIRDVAGTPERKFRWPDNR